MVRKRVWLGILLLGLLILPWFVIASTINNNMLACDENNPYVLSRVRADNPPSWDAPDMAEPVGYLAIHAISSSNSVFEEVMMIIMCPMCTLFAFPTDIPPLNDAIALFENTYLYDYFPTECSKMPYGFYLGDAYWSDDDTPGVFAGGYLYSTDNLYNVTMKLNAHDTSGLFNLPVAGVAFIYPLNNFSRDDKINKYISSNKSVVKYADIAMDDTDTKTIDFNNTPPNAGLYYIASGIGARWGGNPGGKNAGEGWLNISFNKVAFNGVSDLRHVDSNGKGFLISHRLLTEAEINAVFKNYTETDEWLCRSVGGSFIKDIVPVGGSNTNLLIGCCGDDIGGLNPDNATVGTTPDGKNYTCVNKKWLRSDLEGACNDLSPTNNAAYVGSNPNIKTSLDMSNLIGGMDNCCGDDIYHWGFEGDYALEGWNWIGNVVSQSDPSVFQHQGINSLILNAGEISSIANTSLYLYNANTTGLFAIGSGYVWVYISGKGDAKLTLTTSGYEEVGISLFKHKVPRYNTSSSSTSLSNQWVRLNLSVAPLSSVATVLSYTVVLTYSGTGTAYFDDLFIEKKFYINSPRMADYGFVTNKTTNNVITYQYMCYDRASQGDLSFNYTWLNSMIYKYKITTVSTPNGSVDTISNGKDWYYCNANEKNSLGARPVAEGQTFDNKYDDKTYSCAEMMSSYFGDRVFYNDCKYVPVGNRLVAERDCCDNVTKNGVQVEETASFISNCRQCRLQGQTQSERITLDEDTFPPGAYFNDLSGEGDIDIDPCIINPELCLGDSWDYDINSSCNAQPSSFNHKMCNITTEFCSNGIIINTTEPRGTSTDFKCCFGPGSQCKNNSDITSISSCLDNDGKVYSPSPRYSCTSTPINILNTNDFCCLGALLSSNLYASLDAISNKSFLCFKEDGENIFSQCCYDNSCKNLAGKTGYISQFERRVLSKGASIHTIENFDTVTTGNLIVNRGRKLFLGEGRGGVDVSFSIYDINRFPSIVNFTYIEFDVLTDSRDITFSISGKQLGILTAYSTNGAEPRVWHHIVVPLSALENRSFDSITFDTGDTDKRRIIVDNIILTPSTEDLSVNTKPYYCTGGFEGWVDDLDAPLGTTDFGIYGPHMFACSGLASFGWTGAQCCGDDTKGENVNERYNDTFSGCFDGSILKNNQAIWGAKGYFDGSNPLNDRVSRYEFNYLLYTNNTFVGCQMPNRMSPLKVSYNGTLTETDLVSSNIDDQCATFGDYYCMNGEWRQSIRTNNGEDQKFPGTQIELKTIPSGGELIKIGFRKDDIISVSTASPTMFCYGMFVNDADVCNRHGDCVSQDNCSCSAGYEGSECESLIPPAPRLIIPWYCNGIIMNSTDVCGGNGRCLRTGICFCFEGYALPDCESETILPAPVYCNGLLSTNISVCNSQGDCTEDGCSCYTGWDGINCMTRTLLIE